MSVVSMPSGSEDRLTVAAGGPEVDPGVWTLATDRLGEIGPREIAWADRTGGEIGILSVSQRELQTLHRIYGTEVLRGIHRAMIQRIAGALGEQATLVRGAFSLVVFLRGTDAEEVRGLAEALADVLEAPYEVNGHSYWVGTFISCATYPSHVAGENVAFDEMRRLFLVFEDQNEQRHRADSQRVFFLTAERWQSLATAFRLERAMVEDFRSERFHLVYQPRVDLNDGRIVGAEALLRWDSEQFGAVSPAMFIPLAERVGFIHTLTPFVVGGAAAALPGFRARFGKDFSVGVNLSPICIRSRGLLPVIGESLARHGMTGQGMDFEVTETQLLAQTSFVFNQLERLRTLGARTALDDFGTGYSSLSMLSAIPLDYLKIDQTFVADLERPDNDAALAVVRAITAMSDACGLTTIAEGLETHAQVDHLVNEVGCRYGQGFHFARPATAEAVMDLPQQLG